jgi:hypothetical protein
MQGNIRVGQHEFQDLHPDASLLGASASMFGQDRELVHCQSPFRGTFEHNPPWASFLIRVIQTAFFENIYPLFS